MRKLILQLAVSLDGFIEGPNGEYDWCFTDQDYGMTEFLKHSDSILSAQKSFKISFLFNLLLQLLLIITCQPGNDLIQVFFCPAFFSAF